MMDTIEFAMHRHDDFQVRESKICVCVVLCHRNPHCVTRIFANFVIGKLTLSSTCRKDQVASVIYD